MHGAFECLVIGIYLFWFNPHTITQICKISLWGARCTYLFCKIQKNNPMTHYKLGILKRKNYKQFKDH